MPEDTIPDNRINWVQDSTELLRNQVDQLPVTAKAISRETQRGPILSGVKKFTMEGWPLKEDLALSFYRFSKDEMNSHQRKVACFVVSEHLYPGSFKTRS